MIIDIEGHVTKSMNNLQIVIIDNNNINII